MAESKETELKFLLRSSNGKLVGTWKEIFSPDPYPQYISASQGDISLEAPSADLLVVPTNSFGFLAGTPCVAFFGAQIQARLQEMIRDHFSGELLIGQCAIIPAYLPDTSVTVDFKNNQGCPIRYVGFVPNVRVPDDVTDMRAVFLAFRSLICAVKKHNNKCAKGVKSLVPIATILCPNLVPEGSAISVDMSADQMKLAFDAYFLKIIPVLTQPEQLGEVWTLEDRMITIKQKK